MGALHMRYPAYNVVGVRSVLAQLAPEALALTPLPPDFRQTRWQDTPELALPLTVIPWAEQQSVPVYGVFEPSPDPAALDDFRRYANEYPQVQQQLAAVDAHLRPLHELLSRPLTLARILDEVLPLLRNHQEAREQMFEDGPATDWLRIRTEQMAARILGIEAEKVAVLASAEQLPFLQDALSGKAELVMPSAPQADEASRERALLDFAFIGEPPEPGNLIAKLRELDVPEARYHEANLLLANAHVAEALNVLEDLSRGDFSKPYYLPGFVLARLGQLYDLVDKREAALKCYRGVLALSYAPFAALASAEAGLVKPFSGDV